MAGVPNVGNTLIMSHNFYGTIGNLSTFAISGSHPTVPATLTGGSGNGYVFEFDDDSSVRAGSIAVGIGPDVATTVQNLMSAVQAKEFNFEYPTVSATGFSLKASPKT